MPAIGFLYPLLLAIIPAIAAGLVYAYMQRGTAPRRIVASTIILKQLAHRSSARRKVRLPLRFFLELLALSLLALGAAGVYFKGQSVNAVVILDSSLSSGALAREGSLLELLKAEAQRYIDSLPSSSQVAVLQPGDADSKPMQSVSEALRVIAAAEARHNEDNLPQLLSQAMTEHQPDAIAVFSDAPQPAKVPAGVRWQSISLKGLGLSTNNVGITEVVLRGPLSAGESPSLVATVRSFADATANARVIVEVARTLNDIWRPSEIAAQEIELAAQAESAVRFALTSKDQSLAYRIRLEVRFGDQRTGDSLRSDDEAFVTAQPSATRIGVVSPRTLKELGLAELSLFEFDKLEQSKLADTQGELDEYAMILVDRTNLSKFPPISTLFNVSAIGDELVVGAKPTSAEVATWDDSHPLLAYLQLPTLKKTQVLPLSMPLWMHSIVTTTAGPVIAVGASQEARYAATGFDIFPYRGGRDPLLSVLFLNSMKWLSRAALTQGYYALGAPVRPLDAAQRVEFGPNEFVEKDDSGTLVLPPRPGLFVLYPEVDSRNARIIGVNFFSAHESNLASPKPTLIQAAAEMGVANATRQSSSLLRTAFWIALFGIIFLLLDLLLQIVRPRAGVEVS